MSTLFVLRFYDTFSPGLKLEVDSFVSLKMSLGALSQEDPVGKPAVSLTSAPHNVTFCLWLFLGIFSSLLFPSYFFFLFFSFTLF